MPTGRPPHPRLVDWSLLTGAVLVLATGGASLVTGRSEDSWVFALHAVGALALAAVLAVKLYRVRTRLSRPSPRRMVSVVLALVVLGTILTGIWWVHGGTLQIGPWGLLNLHIGLGLLVVPLLIVHLAYRFRLPKRADLAGRRTALRGGAVLVGSAGIWQLQEILNRMLDTAGATRRFTGSRERGSKAGNDFPVTSWMLDNPDPVDPSSWELRISGAVDEPIERTYEDFTTGDEEEQAILDCTSGWYSEHSWKGFRVGELLDEVGVSGDARWVQFVSVTGYRWSLPIEEANRALLATHVDGETLSHGHGFPLRLVAPGRRGFQWVKWVEGIRVSHGRDLSEWLAVLVSGLE